MVMMGQSGKGKDGMRKYTPKRVQLPHKRTIQKRGSTPKRQGSSPINPLEHEIFQKNARMAENQEDDKRKLSMPEHYLFVIAGSTCVGKSTVQRDVQKRGCVSGLGPHSGPLWAGFGRSRGVRRRSWAVWGFCGWSLEGFRPENNPNPCGSRIQKGRAPEAPRSHHKQFFSRYVYTHASL